MNDKRDKVLSTIRKKYGKESIQLLGDYQLSKVDVISSGSLAVDCATGIGGFPRGRITHIYGSESSGKTTLALHTVAQAQKFEGSAAFIDAEYAFDPVYARNLGVDVDKLIFAQPSNGEQGLGIAQELIESGICSCVVIDSVAALVPSAEVQGEMGDAHVGLQARLMSQALRKLSSSVSKNNCLVLFINQIREKVGVVFGNPETTPGGRALKFYSSIEVDVRRSSKIKVGKEVIGNLARIKMAKNKLAPPFRVAEVEIIHGRGISRENDLLTMGLEYQIIEYNRPWYQYKDENIGRGKQNAIMELQENSELAMEIEQSILSAALPTEETNDEPEKSE